MSSLTHDSNGSFNEFIKLCKEISTTSSATEKTAIIKKWFSKYDGSLIMVLRFLLPKLDLRVFNLKRKQMFKVFEDVLAADSLEDEYQTGDDAGDVSSVVSSAFSDGLSKSVVTIEAVEKFLAKLSKLTKFEDQKGLIKRFLKKLTAKDLKWILRIILKDLQIFAGKKAVLDGVSPDAYESFRVRADLEYIARKVSSGKQLSLNTFDVLTPIRPMLAKACKSYEEAFKRCKSGLIYAEIKYDGERIQVHFDGKNWKYFARSLKPANESKISHVKEYLLKACPKGSTFILDSEILMINNKTGELLPFTSLGKHKRKNFADAVPCLFIFDILNWNGESLLEKPLKERRALLESKISEIPNRIMLSKLHEIRTNEELKELMFTMVDEKKEGLMLKDSKGVYGPGKRHWLKMKRDYLGEENCMADSCDCIVLGAFYGTGKHGSLLATFLCGVLDKDARKFRTVCKVHNGLDDETIDSLSKKLLDGQVTPYKREVCPSWLDVDNKYEPDVVVLNPKKAPIFEITGFEYSESSSHTATDDKGKGLSIRFPRVTRIRDDKKYKDATSLQELRVLVKTSRENPGALMGKKRKASDSGPPKKKKKVDPPKKKAVPKPKPKPKIADGGAQKRKLEDSKPKKKRKLAHDPRPKCKYGADCFRRNLEHFEQFRHENLVADDDIDFEPECKIASVMRLEEWFDLQKVMKTSLKETAIQTEGDARAQAEVEEIKARENAKAEYEKKLEGIKEAKESALKEINRKYRQSMDQIGKFFKRVEERYEEYNEELS